MKKFLLSLAVLSGAAFTASADEATITIKGADSKFADKTVADLDKDADFEFTNQGFTFVTSKGGLQQLITKPATSAYTQVEQSQSQAQET